MTKSSKARVPVSACSTLPALLVGIVTRDRAQILPRAIESALAQDYSNIQVAVLDDGSQDCTPALRSAFPNVQWDRWEFGHGLMHARNRLMRTGDALYYLSLDDDAWFLGNDEISIAIEYLENHPRVGALAFDILSPDRPVPLPRTEPRPAASFIGCGHVLRLKAVEAAGYYVPTPGNYGGEEKDMSLRLLNQGWDVHLLPGVHVWHDKTNIARNQPAQHRSGVCNDLVFAVRRCPFPLILVVFPVKLLNHVRFSLRTGLWRPCLAGVALFFRNAIDVLRQRRPVRAATFLDFLQRSHLAR